MSLQFHWGGQVSADIQRQNQMLFDAMPPEEQQRVLAAQAERDALEAERVAVEVEWARKVSHKIGIVILLVGIFVVAVGLASLLIHLGGWVAAPFLIIPVWFCVCALVSARTVWLEISANSLPPRPPS